MRLGNAHGLAIEYDAKGQPAALHRRLRSARRRGGQGKVIFTSVLSQKFAYAFAV